jgi:CheY-like chemotaxis protein
VLPKIFEPFFSTKDIGKGTGLGLASVFGIVQQHQGCIDLDNRPGQGVTFKIYFPALAVASIQPASAADLPANLRGTETIFLVEDEPSLRKLARKILERHGYHVLETANGPEALPLWAAHRETVALLLTDMVLPGGMSGMELSRRLKSERPGLKVVYVSGYSLDAIAGKLELRAGETFIQKPFRPDQLLKTIRQTLDT